MPGADTVVVEGYSSNEGTATSTVPLAACFTCLVCLAHSHRRGMTALCSTVLLFACRMLTTIGTMASSGVCRLITTCPTASEGDLTCGTTYTGDTTGAAHVVGSSSGERRTAIWACARDTIGTA